MTTSGPTFGPIPAAAEGFLADAQDAMGTGKVKRLKLVPLVMRTPLERLVERRQRLYTAVQYQKTPYGYQVSFVRHLKRSKKHPKGRECRGKFSLVRIADDVVMVASSLRGDDHQHGPLRFANKAYPLARRPFFPSTTLIRLIEQFATRHVLTAVASETWGYHRQSRKMRHDMNAQTPAAAAREMAEQSRQVHKMRLRFAYDGRETSRYSFDRSASVTVIKGNPAAAVRGLILPGVSEAISSDATYQVARAPEPVYQELVELEFQDEPFDSYDAMRSLCDSVRHGDGLNVSIIHLNPYLQAQILDFFTGGAVEMLVTDSRSISLIPRSAECGPAIERVATTIYRYFGEAKARRMRIVEGV